MQRLRLNTRPRIRRAGERRARHEERRQTITIDRQTKSRTWDPYRRPADLAPIAARGNHKKMPTQAVLVVTSEVQSSTAQRSFLSTTWKELCRPFLVEGRRFSKHDRQ